MGSPLVVDIYFSTGGYCYYSDSLYHLYELATSVNATRQPPSTSPILQHLLQVNPQ